MIEPKKHLKTFTQTPKVRGPRIGKVVRLGRNERTTPFPADVVSNIFSEISGDDLVALPELEPFYAKLSEYLSVDRQNLLLFSGSDTGIKSVFEVYVEVGDEVVHLSPTYHRYITFCKVFAAKRVSIDYDSDLRFDFERLVTSVTASTKLVILPNPNNPTGTTIETHNLLRVIEKAKSVGALVLVDEAYYHFYRETVLPYIGRYENLMVLRTFSKAFGVAGVRIGYMAANPGIIKELYKVKLNYEITGISAKIGHYLLDHPEIMQDYVDSIDASKRQLIENLPRFGIRVMPSAANFMLMKLPDSIHISDLLSYCMETASIELTNNFKNPFEQFIRVTLGPLPQMQHLVEVLGTYFNQRA